MSAQSTILIGNPGTGKSSTINCYLGVNLFKSGVSHSGFGVTYKLDCQEHNGTQYMDTPGLSDLRLRKEAAQAIDEALKIGGDFKIVFAMTTESGRLKPDDLTTMKLVFDAADQIGPNEYAIFVNKCKKKWLRDFTDEKKEAWLDNLRDALTSRNVPPTEHVHFAPIIEDLDEENDALADLDPKTIAFIDSLPVLKINPEKVQEINADSFEEITAEFEARISEAEEAVAAANAKAKEEQIAREKAEMEKRSADKKAQDEAAKATEAAKRAQNEAAKAAEANKRAKNEEQRAAAAAKKAKDEEEKAAEANKRATAFADEAKIAKRFKDAPTALYVINSPTGWGWLCGKYTREDGDVDGYPIWKQQTCSSWSGVLPFGAYYTLQSNNGYWRFQAGKAWVKDYPSYESNNLHSGYLPHLSAFGRGIEISRDEPGWFS